MKKFLAILLSVLLLLSTCSAAFAETAGTSDMAVYSSTRAFLTYMDAIGIKYTYGGIDSDGDEKITIANRDNDINFEYDIVLYFDSNEQNCYIYIWNIIQYEGSNSLQVYKMCNALNTSYRFVTFEADTSDNTITLRMDLIFRSQGVDEIVWEALLRMANILKDTYPTLRNFSK